MRLFALCLILLAHPVQAQDREGRDTPGDWIVDHHRTFGLWDSMCDRRTTEAETERRCYIRYVDVFSARPAFGAQFVFVTPGPRIAFGIEPGTLFRRDGFRIERDGQIVWASPQAGCMGGLACIYEDRPATYLYDHMTRGGVFVFEFRDRHGQRQVLEWDLAAFAAARADFETHSAARGL